MLDEHHIKYKEIHGVDETIWLTHSEHQKLHKRLRREGKCNVPSDILRKISTSACQRTNKIKEYLNKYRKEAYPMVITFTEPLLPCVRLHERIYYNFITGTVSFSSNFSSSHGKKILFIGES